MRLLLDEMYPGRLAEQLRAAGLDVVAVLELPELIGAPDRAVLDRAAADGCVVVTENVQDFAPMADLAASGLLLVNAARWPRTRAGQVRLADALIRWASATSTPAAGATTWL